jgi:hypothetical protein
MTEIKIGQKWQDNEGCVRHITAVSDARVSYSFTHAGSGNIMGTGDIADFQDDILIADEGSITFTKKEATLLKRLLAGYYVGKAGQSILDKLGAIVVVLLMCCSMAYRQNKYAGFHCHPGGAIVDTKTGDSYTCIQGKYASSLSCNRWGHIYNLHFFFIASHSFYPGLH